MDDITYIKSENVYIYPTGNRKNGDNTKINPAAKLNTEFNITNQIAQLITANPNRCFVVDYDNTTNAEVLKLCMAGYYIELKYKLEGSSKYAVLYVKNTLSSSEQYKDQNIYEVYNGYPNATSTDLDETIQGESGEESKFVGLGIVESEPNSGYYLQIWDGEKIPANSYLKFNANDIDGYAISEIHEPLQESVLAKRNPTGEGTLTINGLHLNKYNRGTPQITFQSRAHTTDGITTNLIAPTSDGEYTVEYNLNLPVTSGTLIARDSSSYLTANRLLIGLDSNKLQDSTLSFSNDTLKNNASESNIAFDSANKVVINNASTGGSSGYALTVNGTAHVNGLYSDTYINATNGIFVQSSGVGVLTQINGDVLDTGSISCYNLDVSEGDDGGGSASIEKDLFVGENAFVSGSLEVSGTDVSTKFNSLDTSVTNVNTTLNNIRDKKLVRHDFEIQCDWTPTGQNAHRAVVLMTLFDDNDTDYSFTSSAQASVKENFVKRLFDNSNVSTGGGTTHGRRYFASGFISSNSDGDYKTLYNVYLLDPAAANVFRLNYYGYLTTTTSVTLNPADISHVYDSHKVVLNFNNV